MRHSRGPLGLEGITSAYGPRGHAPKVFTFGPLGTPLVGAGAGEGAGEGAGAGPGGGREGKENSDINLISELKGQF